MNAAPLQAGRPAATIMVLDDDPQLRVGAARALTRMGYRVLAAGSAAEAMRVSGDWPAAIDLLICDLVLPGLSGREAANALMARRPGMKVLYTSGYSSHGSFRGELAEGSSSFLGKPFDLASLGQAVAVMLDGGRRTGGSADDGEGGP